MVPNPISDIGMLSPSLVLRYGEEEEEEEEEEEHSRDALALLRLPPPPRIDDDVVAGIERARGAGDMRDDLRNLRFRARGKRLKSSRENRNKKIALVVFTNHNKTRCPPSDNTQNNRNNNDNNNNNNNERCVAKS